MEQNISKAERKLIEQIVKLLQQGKYETVIGNGKNYIKDYPDQPFVYIGIGIAFSESGDTDVAIPFLKNAIEKFPDNYEILFQLAKLYEDKLDYKNAIKYLYKSFDVTPPEKRRGRADCYNDIGAILFRQGKEEEALKLWKQALVIDPANSNVKVNLKISEGDENIEDATELINNEFSDFVFYQMDKYFEDKNKEKFSSKKEEKFFRDKVEEVFFKVIVPQMVEIEKMTEDEKIDLYTGTFVNFDEPVGKIEIPKLGNEISEQLQNIFPYLPEDSILMMMLVLPALEYSGISENKINNFIEQSETPDAKETSILKWAYELGTKVYGFCDMDESEEKELAFIEIMKLLSEELDENDSFIVMESIMERLEDEDLGFE